MKIAVVTFYSGNPDFGVEENRKRFNQVGEITASIDKQYAERHGYDFIVKTEGFNIKGRHFHFEKQQLLLEKLPDYDWIFYLDADAFITNHTVRLEEIISKYQDSDIIVGHGLFPQEGKGGSRLFNAGVFFIKNSEWSINYLKEVLKDRDIKSDNVAMINVCKKMKAVDSGNIKIVSRKLFNCYGNKADFDWEQGDFLMHIVCSDNEYRLNLLKDVDKYLTK